MKSNRLATALFSMIVAVACARGVAQPAALERGESCRWCRMAVSDQRFAAQLTGAETLFFDDIGCMANYLRKSKDAADLTAYVADHRTREWIPAATASYERCPAVETPMGSHLLAHRDAASARTDHDSANCKAATAAEIFGTSLPKGSAR